VRLPVVGGVGVEAGREDRRAGQPVTIAGQLFTNNFLKTFKNKK
jgi:hypothetical protein